MARRKRAANCERCGRRFELCRYNAHQQKYCTVESCVNERRRERQRDNYRKKYRHDDEFRKAERARCHDGISRRRAQRTTAAACAVPPTAVLNMELFATGLLAQMIDSSDPKEVHDAARALERRGHRLAAGAHLARVSPG